MFPSGQMLSGELRQCVLELEANVEKLIAELDADLLKSKEENKNLRKELEQSEARNKELNNVVLDQRKTLSSYEEQLKHLKSDLAQSEAHTENLKKELDQVAAATALVHQHESRIEIMTKEHDSLIREHNQALKERDLAFVYLNTTGEELKEAQKELELGKKVLDTERISHAETLNKAKEAWDAENVALAERLTKAEEVFDAERKGLAEMFTKAKEVWESERLAQAEAHTKAKEVWDAERKELVEMHTNAKEVWESERLAQAEMHTKAKEVWDADRKELAEMHTNAKEVWESERLAQAEMHTKAKEVWDAERKELADTHTKAKEAWESERLAMAETHTKEKEVWNAEKITLFERFTKVKEVWEAETKALAERLTKVEVWKDGPVRNMHSTSIERGEEWQPKGTCKIQQLSQALVMDILSRLSVKSLFNCSRVCKAWHVLIYDSGFAHLHHSRSLTGILIHTYPTEGPSSELDFTQIDQCLSSDSSELWLENLKFSPDYSLPISKFKLWNSCNGVLCMSGPDGDGCCYVCNPILGEFITIPYSGRYCGFVGVGFGIKTNQCKLLRMSHPVITPSSCDVYCRAEVYTMGTGVWRSLGIVRKCGSIKAPFDAILHGALHWVSFWGKSNEFIHSFDFEREEFRRIPPPSNFGLIEKQYTDSLKLGVLGDCLILSVFAADSSRFDMWVMKDYGIQGSWTRSVVIENFFPMERSFVCYEPIMLLRDGEILMFNDDDPRVIVSYNQEAKSLRETRITSTTSPLIQLAYCPSFISLHNVSNGEEVKRVKDLKTSCLG